MRRPCPTWLRSSALVLTLPGCLVSFNDYPLGDPNADEPMTLLGGAAGTGSVLPNAGSALLVDDFQDTDAQILELQGRSGAWYVANDGRGLQTPRAGVPLVPAPLMPARGGSTRGVHTFGGPFSDWGALVGTQLASEGGTGVAYDLSGYTGLRVWVRSGAAAPNAAKSVRLNLRTPATVMGGSCTVCTDHFGADIPLTAQWAQIDLRFASLQQVGFGVPKLAKPDLTQALSIEFLFPANVSFDLWLDDIELY